MSFNDTASFTTKYPLASVLKRLQNSIVQVDAKLHAMNMHLEEMHRLVQKKAPVNRISAQKKTMLREQRDLKDLIIQLSVIKDQVVQTDQERLQDKLEPIFSEYKKVAEEFKRVSDEVNMYCAHKAQVEGDLEREYGENSMESSTHAGEKRRGGQKEINLREDVSFIPMEMTESMLQTVSLAEAEALEREDAMAELERDILEINDMMKHLSSVIKTQGERLDLIETQVIRASGSVERGTSDLLDARILQTKSVAIPLAGAAIGGVLLGPVGYLAGLKIGGLFTAAVGAGLGGLAGSWIQGVQKNQAVREKKAFQEAHEPLLQSPQQHSSKKK